MAEVRCQEPRALARGLGWAFAAASVAAASQACADTAVRDDWRPIYTVGNVGGGAGIFVDEVAVFSRRVAGGGAAFWTMEIRSDGTTIGRRTVSHHWVDGRRCPSLVAALAKLPTLAAGGLASPERAGAADLVLDASETRVSGPSRVSPNVRLTVADFSGPVSLWWSDSKASLKPCLQEAAPMIGDQQATPLLATPADAERWRP